MAPVPGACATAPTVSDADAQVWLRATSRPPITPVIASSQQVCGPNRLLIGLLDAENRSVGAPDRSLEVAFYNLGRDPDQPVASATGEFVWAIEDSRGLYVVTADFPESGVWGAEIRTTAAGAAAEVVRVGFEVRATGFTKRVGEAAPASETPTAEDVDGNLARLSTDAEPEPRFYETSVADALTAGEPFALVFATPKFCTSAVCGPTLDKVKPFVDAYPSVTFINVEPYALEWDGSQLQPALDANGQLTPVESVTEWGIVTEPWIFVVDRGGTIRGSFEGVIGDAELRAALDEVQ